MKERKQEELDHYRDIALLTVAQNALKVKRAEMNQHAKRALEMLRKDVSTADDDALADFASNMAIIAATIRNMPLALVSETLEKIFNNSALVTASLMGVYDLEDDGPVPTYETLVEGIKERAVASEAAKPAPKTDDEWWEQTLSRQYM